jgi:2-oxoglutarate ferredoxin oxidoreductase subunit alpha
MSIPKHSPTHPPPRGPVEELDEVTIRFAGDAADGMQMAGNQFGAASAACGNDVNTLPDLPAEIRAPAGALAGVSGLQIHFSSEEIHTPGDVLNALVVMNPAALRAHLADLEPGGVLIVNTDAFTPDNLQRAGYAHNPLEDGSLHDYRVLAVPIAKLNGAAVAPAKLTPREADRCKNFFALGLACWLYERPLEPTLHWVGRKFESNPSLREAHSLTVLAGYAYGEVTEALPVHYRVARAELPPGRYRRLNGTEALALGLTTAADRAGLPLVFAGYPISPATELLHRMCDLKYLGVQAVQAEDEIAAINLAVGAAFGGVLGATATSGPGLSLKAETLGLAVMAELPLVVIDVQRAGPATGLPSKVEQADLLQALFGRHGECPLPVLAPCSPADGFAIALEAVRLAVRYMTPVLVLSDGYLVHGGETWRVPGLDELPDLTVERPATGAPGGTEPFLPYRRDERLARPWATPGTPGLEHRTGAMEKEDLTGNVSYDPFNHEWMVQTRARKVANISADIPPLAVDGPECGDLLVLGWGSTYGAIQAAVRRARRKGLSVAAAHLRYLNPMPRNTAEVLGRYRKVLVPELNTGQLRLWLRATYLVDAVGLNKVQGRPFLVSEIERKIEQLLYPERGASAPRANSGG